MLPFYVKDPRLCEGDKCNKNESGNVQNLKDPRLCESGNVQNLRKTLAFARVTTVKKEGNDVQNLKDPRLREGDDSKQNFAEKRVRRGHDLFL